MRRPYHNNHGRLGPSKQIIMLERTEPLRSAGPQNQIRLFYINVDDIRRSQSILEPLERILTVLDDALHDIHVRPRPQRVLDPGHGQPLLGRVQTGDLQVARGVEGVQTDVAKELVEGLAVACEFLVVAVVCGFEHVEVLLV
jgi:hypothetical protein